MISQRILDCAVCAPSCSCGSFQQMSVYNNRKHLSRANDFFFDSKKNWLFLSICGIYTTNSFHLIAMQLPATHGNSLNSENASRVKYTVSESSGSTPERTFNQPVYTKQGGGKV